MIFNKKFHFCILGVSLFVGLQGLLFRSLEAKELATKSKDFPPFLMSSPCKMDIFEILKKWNQSGEFTQLGTQYFWQTMESGKTLEDIIQYDTLHEDTNNAKVAEKSLPIRFDRVVKLNKKGQGVVVLLRRDNCDREIMPVKTNSRVWKFKNIGPVFNDHTLFSMARNSETAIFYSISPHMIYSELGWKDASLAAKSLNIPIVLLLDDQADFNSVEDLVKRSKISRALLRPIDSQVLKRLGLTVHYPSYLYMKSGRLLSARHASKEETKEDYEKLFSSVFK